MTSAGPPISDVATGRLPFGLDRPARLTGLLLLLALGATFTSDFGSYVADARFEHFWGSEGYLARHRSLWDDARTLGRPTLYFSPVVASFLAALSGLGVPPWAAERILHATYLTVAGTGMVQVLRLHRSRIGTVHLVAALVFMFNPYTSQFLVPSGLFLHYAVAPWLAAAFGFGVRQPRSWFWPAVFGLGIFSLGSLNAASLGYALLPLVPLAGFVLGVQRSASLRDAARWTLRAGLLALGCSVTALLVVRASAPIIAQNLSTTELPEAVSSRSSWSESLRGLGSWLSYLRGPSGPLKPQAQAYFDAPGVVAATYVAPIVAVASLAFGRSRQRALYGLWMVLGLIAMVGLFPASDPPPLGQFLATLYDEQLGARGFRDGYKAGALLMLATSALVASGIVEVLPRLIRSTGVRRLAGAGIGAGLLVAAFPFWTGGLYAATEQVDEVPEYWEAATDWLDRAPEEGSVMVVPGFNRTRYRWGYVGDDIFDALLARRHVTSWSLPKATPETGNLVDVIDRLSTRSDYRAGTVAPIARRLGIRWLVIRNDTDWQALDGPRPLDLDPLRNDSDLELAATFGDPGQNVSATASDPAAGEADLPPVEIYRVSDVVGGARIDRAPHPILISGDGTGTALLAGDGVLDSAGPFAYSGSIGDEDLISSLEGGAGVFVTDTNRRRITQALSTRNRLTRTLFDRETFRRAPVELFEREGTQSTLVHPEGVQMTASNDASSAFDPTSRSGNAFDRVAATAWSVALPGDAITISFDEPRRIDTVEVDTVADAETGGRIESIEVAVGIDRRESVEIGAAGSARLVVDDEVSLLRIEIDQIDGELGDDLGIAEIRVDDLDLAELVEVPDDLWRRARSDERVMSALAASPLHVRLHRDRGFAVEEPEEAVIRRRFWTDRTRTFDLRGGGGTAVRELISDGSDCPGAMTIDGSTVGIRERAGPGRVDGAVAFEACAPLVLSPGWHELTTDPGLAFAIDHIALDDTALEDTALSDTPTAGRSSREVVPAPALGDDRPASDVHQVETPGWLIIDEAYDEGWAAEVGGAVKGPRRLDTMNAWWIAEPGRVATWYRAQQFFDIAIVVNGAVVASAIWIVFRRRPRTDRWEQRAE